MSLPGKFCIGILEEDNPLKSYFRFKPLLVEQDGRYVAYDSRESYPEDGCIRIVPDKNESSHFKARMRRIGLFAIVDLTEHPADNDKIRVNKNYDVDEAEHNAFIIYSDVVREPVPGTLFSLLRLTPEEAQNAVLTPIWPPQALLCPEGGALGEIWSYQPNAESPEEGSLSPTGEEINPDRLQIFNIPGFRGETLSFAVLTPDQTVSPKEAASDAPPEPPAEAPDSDKPWIRRDSVPAPSPVDKDLPAFQKFLAEQSGLNPRRGRSLQEIIDDKWRHSRFDQLGQPVSELVSAMPAQNPVEQAVSIVRDLWQRAGLRDDLLRAFTEIDGLERALEIRRAAYRDSLVSKQLTELESQRLELLSDLDTLKHHKADLRESLKQEIRRDEADAFADAVQKTEQARAEQERFEEAAARAKTAAETAEDALNALTDGRFEQRLNEFAIQSRAVELIQNLRVPRAVPLSAPSVAEDAEALIDRVTTCFADAGRTIDRNEAIHLLICAAQSDFVLLSGPSGCGKSETARLMARALGMEDANFAEFAPGSDAPTALPGGQGDAAAMVLLDDANLSDSADLTRGLTPAAEREQFLCWATLQDDGYPVPAHLFDRAFTLRLSGEAASTPWKPAPSSAPRRYEPVCRQALRAAFAPQDDGVPEALTHRMEQLRAQLDLINVRLSRRTLTALWNYCAAAVPRMQLEPCAILDRALAERALPVILASAPLDALHALPKLFEDLPRCRALFATSLPIRF